MNNQYPRGKLNDQDEGQLAVRISTKESKTVVINFNKLISWIGFSKEEAIVFARVILEHARKIK